MPSFPTAVPAALDLLRTYDTPTICNVIELFDIRPRTAGYMDGRIQACFPHCRRWSATPARRRSAPAPPPRAGNVYAGLAEQVASFAASPGPAVVVFQDLDDPCVAATFGEVMCTTYKAFGAVGLITSGAGRDLDQVEALGFPCFTERHDLPRTATATSPQLDVPVHVGGVTVHPGDLLHGDRNGVTTIPTRSRRRVADACPEVHGRRGGGAGLPEGRPAATRRATPPPGTSATGGSRCWPKNSGPPSAA